MLYFRSHGQRWGGVGIKEAPDVDGDVLLPIFTSVSFTCKLVNTYGSRIVWYDAKMLKNVTGKPEKHTANNIIKIWFYIRENQKWPGQAPKKYAEAMRQKPKKQLEIFGKYF